MGLLAHLCGAPRGQKEWALFAKGLSQTQRRVLRSCARSAEAVAFPCIQQVARLRRHLRQHLRQHSPETVALATSRLAASRKHDE